MGNMISYNKTIIDGDLWYIDNFLTQEELDFFKPFMDDHEGWYTTMRSPYKNILNKFVEFNLEKRPDGSTGVPGPGDLNLNHEILLRPNGLFDRITQVMPPVYKPHAGLQTFKFCTDEEIKRDFDFNKAGNYGGIGNTVSKNEDISKIDYAMNWHYEWDENSSIVPEFNRSLSIYLNDDFEGGILEFKNKPYTIKAKAGRLVAIPVTKEFEHRVTKITSGNWRHTLYGASWNFEFPPDSTEETC
jgi:hypothetical protein